MATKTDIVRVIAKDAGVTQDKATKMLESFLDYMCDCLKRGEAMNLTGYFSVNSVHKPEHEGRNPQTGEIVKVPAKNRVAMKPGKLLKESCNS